MERKKWILKKLCALSLVFVMCFTMFPYYPAVGAEGTEQTEETCQWKTETTMPMAIHGCKNIIEKDGKIYIVGGLSSSRLIQNEVICNKVIIYDTNTKQWSTGKDIPQAYAYSNYALVGDKIYVMGGETCAPAYTKYTNVYVYDITNDTWETAKPMPKAYCCAGTAVIGDKIYVIGGYGGEAYVQIYDTKNNSWTVLDTPSAKAKQAYGACHLYKGKVYMIGGEYWTTTSNSIKTVNIYNPESNRWTTGKEMPDALTHTASVIDGNKIYIMGGTRRAEGKDAVYTDKVYIYDIDKDEWMEGPKLSSGRYGSIAAFVNNKIYLFGGTDANTMALLDKVEVLDLKPEKQDQDKLRILMYENEKQQLSVSYQLEENMTYQWTSSDESVVSVNEKGVATAVGEGEAEVTVASLDGSYTETIAIKVINMRKLAANIQEGGTVRLYLTEDAAAVIWKSGNEEIATVDETGIVTGKKKGLVAITAELEGKTYELYVRVSEAKTE